MPDYRSHLLPEPMRSVNSASFDGTYKPFRDSGNNISPTTYASRVLLFVNDTGVNVTISWDGTNDALVLLPGAGFTLDENANAVAGTTLVTIAGTQFYAKGAASTGLVYLTTFYVS